MTRITIKTLLLTTMTLLLSACASTDANAQAAADPCAKLYKPNKRLTLLLDEFELVLRHKKRMCLDFRKINTATFKIEVDVGNSGYSYTPEHAITVEGKSTATGAPVISGTNSATEPDVITVKVTDANPPLPDSADYNYWIKVPDVGMLDPKVRIIRGPGFAPIWAQDVEAALQDLGVTLEDIGLDREELESLLGEKFEAQQP